MKSLLGGGEPAKDKKGKYIKKKDRVSAAENNSSWRVVSDLLVHPKKNAQRRSGVYEHIEFQQNKHDECLFQVLTCISIQNTLFQRGCYTCISSPRLATLFRQRAASAARELTSRMLGAIYHISKATLTTPTASLSGWWGSSGGHLGIIWGSFSGHIGVIWGAFSGWWMRSNIAILCSPRCTTPRRSAWWSGWLIRSLHPTRLCARPGTDSCAP